MKWEEHEQPHTIFQFVKWFNRYNDMFNALLDKAHNEGINTRPGSFDDLLRSGHYTKQQLIDAGISNPQPKASDDREWETWKNFTDVATKLKKVMHVANDKVVTVWDY